MVPFSERYGYVKPRKALLREEINIDVQMQYAVLLTSYVICTLAQTLKAETLNVLIQKWRRYYGYTS